MRETTFRPAPRCKELRKKLLRWGRRFMSAGAMRVSCFCGNGLCASCTDRSEMQLWKHDSSSGEDSDEMEQEREEKKPRTKLDMMLDGEADDEDELNAEHYARLGRQLKVKNLEGMCVECEDQASTIECEQCQDQYCSLCFQAQHKKGKRTAHTTKSLLAPAEAPSALTSPADGKAAASAASGASEAGPAEVVPLLAGTLVGSDVLERARYIPVRLDRDERKQLRLLEAAMKVSEYTDKVDILSYQAKSKRIHAQIKEMCAILSGLVVATDYNVGQALIKDRSFQDNEGFFQGIFELGRRYKITNPEKMRTEYGKLIYLLQDSAIPQIEDLLGFRCVQPIRTVYSFLESKNALAVLRDEHIGTATREIVASASDSRYEVQRQIKIKERAVDHIATKYAHSDLSRDAIKWCLYSISDNNAYLRCNRDPVDKMIKYLTAFFKPDVEDPHFSLSIHYGQGGARLSHTHELQFYYVLQSLTLWREILNDMFKLWYLGEEDLLSGDSPYRLTDTGQGLNRVQAAPRVYRHMQKVLHTAQQKVGHWVGSSVVHLGDHNVPNALMFIDKYCQVPRILTPIVSCLDQLDELTKNEGLAEYIENTFKSVKHLKKLILHDFFRHAFDGSGADNFFDAGSCIDGRLTSAWNWCSKLEKKPYFPVFLLTGFIGFDGEFQQ